MYIILKVIKLRVLITKRVRWEEKQVFDSRSIGSCGWGWQTLAFVCWVCCIIFCYQVYSWLSTCFLFFSLVCNDLLDEKEAEKRATMYRPKTPLKRERKLQFCRVSAFFYASLL